MVAISFSVFEDKILSGEKRQTIRPIRKRPVKPGDQVQLYWKQQSHIHCRKIAETVCTNVLPIQIYRNGFILPICAAVQPEFEELRQNFAKADGFDSWQDLVNYIDESYGFPFQGCVIYWQYPLIMPLVQ